LVHKIDITNEQKKTKVSYATVHMIKRCILKVLEVEGLSDVPHEVSVTLVCNPKIRRINREFRQMDKATDVLSFPVLNYDENHQPIYDEGDLDFNDNQILLGDIVISMERAQQQAEEYGHSLQREVGFLTVHSMYHLLGYDHMEEEERKEMRQKEEHVLTLLGLTR
jgi:probable rRNA maturation factor